MIKTIILKNQILIKLQTGNFHGRGDLVARGNSLSGHGENDLGIRRSLIVRTGRIFDGQHIFDSSRFASPAARAKHQRGLIEPMSCAFCADCTRIRITADGKLKPCLHSDAELALRGLSGAELEAAIRRGILMKPARHRMDETGVTETHRGMFAIGG